MDAVDLHDLPRDDVLGQRTRRRLFALLADSGGAATTEELATRLGLHPNGVRNHLQRMAEAGVVLRRRAPRPRGRPRDEWALSPTAIPGGDPPLAYTAIARWLARAIPATPARLREVEREGREIGRELAPEVVSSPRQAIRDSLTALGFQPEIASQAEDGLSCRLRNCPYRESVRANQDVVCSLHRGLTRGLLDQVAPGATLARFVPHDPERAGCEIDIEGLAAAPG
jgi:predicted ArsR family transcriptional regulator